MPSRCWILSGSNDQHVLVLVLVEPGTQLTLAQVQGVDGLLLDVIKTPLFEDFATEEPGFGADRCAGMPSPAPVAEGNSILLRIGTRTVHDSWAAVACVNSYSMFK